MFSNSRTIATADHEHVHDHVNVHVDVHVIVDVVVIGLFIAKAAYGRLLGAFPDFRSLSLSLSELERR